jgi:uncharacterized protein (TIGR03083 family)
VTQTEDLDFAAEIVLATTRFADSLVQADPLAEVPTCPGWTADDLAWHLAELQSFWAAIVHGRLADPREAPQVARRRPADLADTLALVHDTAAHLADALHSTPPDETVWTWSTDRRVAFVARAQAHEAAIHAVDARAFRPPSPEPQAPPLALAVDGIDMALRLVMPSPTSSRELGSGTGSIEATDTRATWRVRISPDANHTHPCSVAVVDDTDLEAGSFTLRGGQIDLPFTAVISFSDGLMVGEHVWFDLGELCSQVGADEATVRVAAAELGAALGATSAV